MTIAVLVFFVLLLLTLSIRVQEETWYSPFSFFALLWTFIIGFSIFTAPEYFFSWKALGFITVNVFIFYTGGLVTEKFSRSEAPAFPPGIRASNRFLEIHFYTATLAGFLSLYF